MFCFKNKKEISEDVGAAAGTTARHAGLKVAAVILAGVVGGGGVTYGVVKNADKIPVIQNFVEENDAPVVKVAGSSVLSVFSFSFGFSPLSTKENGLSRGGRFTGAKRARRRLLRAKGGEGPKRAQNGATGGEGEQTATRRPPRPSCARCPARRRPLPGGR